VLLCSPVSRQWQQDSQRKRREKSLSAREDDDVGIGDHYLHFFSRRGRKREDVKSLPGSWMTVRKREIERKMRETAVIRIAN
jgi:hypothetical protein